MIGLSIGPLVGSVTAETTVTQFGGGLDSVSLTGNGTVDLDLERNTTVTSASFEVRYEVTDPTPGAIQMDIGDDGLHEWRFGGTRDGDLGKQTRFSDNSSTASSTLVPVNWLPTSWTFDVPTEADVDTADLNLSFEPDVGGAVISSGSLDDMVSADIDGDLDLDFLALRYGNVLEVRPNNPVNAGNKVVEGIYISKNPKTKFNGELV